MVSGKYLLEHGMLFKSQAIQLINHVWVTGSCGCGRQIVFSHHFVNAESANLAIAEDCKDCPRCRQIAAEHSEATPTP